MATALPTIVAKLGGGKDYSWVGRFVPVVLFMICFYLTWFSYSAYLLAAASLGTIYGKVSDIFGAPYRRMCGSRADLSPRRPQTSTLLLHSDFPGTIFRQVIRRRNFSLTRCF